jgi:hypothetical protein
MSADISAWSIFWDAFWILLIWIPLVLLWGIALFDIFFRNPESGGKKAAWAVLVVLVPYVGAIIYLMKRPARDEEAAAASPPRSQDAVLAALQRASSLHDDGKLSDVEYAAIKRSLVETGSD